jgi:hypothetical protein
MRINYFVGIEGNLVLAYKILEMDPRTAVYETCAGQRARMRVIEMGQSIEDILIWLFGQDKLAAEELNIGITRVGAQGPMLTTLWEKSPAGTRVFFFKSADDATSINKYTSFLKGASAERVEIVTGMQEEILESSSTGYQEVTDSALTALDECASEYSASPWNAFDLNSFFGDPADATTSSLLFRLATKV